MRRTTKVVSRGALVAYVGYVTWMAVRAIQVVGIQKRALDNMQRTLDAQKAMLGGEDFATAFMRGATGQ